tara:strand:- start:247 stop:1023 length:777 start_codon:yes stop_codon:yes gene_type:complete
MEPSTTAEHLLKEISEHTAFKSSWYITITGKDSHIRTLFSPPINVPPGCHYEMALCSVEMYYSFPNIDEKNNSIKLSNDSGKTWHLIKLPKGCYEINAINEAVKRLFVEKTKGKKDDICISGDPATLKSILVLGKTAAVDFATENSLASVLGFTKKTYIQGRHPSEHIVNILRVNSIIVNCDIVALSRKNGIASPIIYNFFPNVSPGKKIVDRPRNLIYLPLILNEISEMNVWLSDQSGERLDIQEEELTITFHMKAC